MLIRNGTVLTFGSEPKLIENGAVAVEGDTIVAVGTTEELEAEYGETAGDLIDASGKLIMPGLICAHGHFYGAFSRGMPLNCDAPSSFTEILERLWWRLDRALTLEDCTYSALLTLPGAIRAGTTTIIDHHASPNAIEGSLDAVAEATKRAGLRLSTCYEVTDRNGAEGAQAGIDENIRFLKRCAAERDPLVTASFGLHASCTCSDETLEKCVAAADALDFDAGFHIHVAEGEADVEDSLERSNKRVVHRLGDLGILGPHSLAIHCVHVDESEIDRLHSTGTNVIHNPESNMNNAVGVADVLAMLEKGIPVGLGTDGFTLDMWREMKVAYILHKLAKEDPRVFGAEPLQMCYQHNAHIASVFWDKPLGELTPGAYADIIIVNYRAPTPLDLGNFPWHAQFGLSAVDVDTTIVGGKVLMQEGELTTLDEAAIMAHARELAPEIWSRLPKP